MLIVSMMVCAVMFSLGASLLNAPAGNSANNISQVSATSSSVFNNFASNDQITGNGQLETGFFRRNNIEQPEMFTLRQRAIVGSDEVFNPVFTQEEMTRIMNGRAVPVGFIVLNPSAHAKTGAKDDTVLDFEIRNMNRIDWVDNNHADLSWVRHNGNLITEEVDTGVPTMAGKLGFDNGSGTTSGWFWEQGYYEFNFRISRQNQWTAYNVTISFAFYIVHSESYEGGALPFFDESLIATCSFCTSVGCSTCASACDHACDICVIRFMNGVAPISQPILSRPNFFYNFQGDIPTIRYDADRFLVSITHTNSAGVRQTYDVNDPKFKVGEVGNDRLFMFDLLGVYRINVSIVYTVRFGTTTLFAGADTTGRKLSPFEYTLDVIGVQAYVQEDFNRGTQRPFWHYDPLDAINNESSDISSIIASSAIDLRINASATSQQRVDRANASIRALVNYLDENSATIIPVVTNAPPVVLRHNITHTHSAAGGTILSRIMFRQSASHEWIDEINYVVGRPLDRAGEYAIIVYYTYSIATNAPTIFHQAFYFRLSSVVHDIRVGVLPQGAQDNTAWGVHNTHSLAEFVDMSGRGGSAFNASNAFFLFNHNRDGGAFTRNVGRFQIPVRITLTALTFEREPMLTGGTGVNANVPVAVNRPYDQITNGVISRNGIYVFTIHYGVSANIASNSASLATTPFVRFEVILDSQPISGFEAISSYKSHELPNISDAELRKIVPTISEAEAAAFDINNSVAIVGSDDVIVRWNAKDSGVEMKSAMIHFFPFVRIPNQQDMLTDTGRTDMPSQFQLGPVTPHPMRMVQEQQSNKWRLENRLSASGIYIIVITDASNNVGVFTLIIDATFANFAQNTSGEGADFREINIRNSATAIGFGTDKLIVDNVIRNNDNSVRTASVLGDIERAFGGQGHLFRILASEDVGLFIPNRNVGAANERRGGVAIPISNVKLTRDNGTPVTVFNGAGTSHVVLDEEGMYFFELVDATGNTATHYIQINFDKAQSLILEDSSPISVELTDTTTIVGNRGIANRGFVSFSFVQQPAGQLYHVSELRVVHYDLLPDESNRKIRTDENGNALRFQQGDTIPTGYQVGDLIPDYRLLDNPNYPFSYLPSLSQRMPAAAAGSGLSVDAEKRVFVRMFQTPRSRPGLYVVSRIMDKVGIGEDNQLVMHYYFVVDNNPIISHDFVSDIQIAFGDDAAKTARWAHFQKSGNADMIPNFDRAIGADGIARINSGLIPSFGRIIDADGEAQISLPHRTSNEIDRDTKYGIGRFRVGHMLDNGDVFRPTEEGGIVFQSMKIRQEVWHSPVGSVLNFENRGNRALNESGIYRVVFTDGSGGYSWQLGRATPRSSANRSEVLLQLHLEGPRAAFYMNGRQVMESAYSFGDGTNTRLFSTMASDTDQLVFSFTNNDEDFISNIASVEVSSPLIDSGRFTQILSTENPGTVDAIPRINTAWGMEVELKSNGVIARHQEPGSALMEPSTLGTFLTYELKLDTSNLAVGKTREFIFRVQNDQHGATGVESRYIILLDNNGPSMNLQQRIRSFEQDNYFFSLDAHSTQHVQANEIAANTTPDGLLKYPHKISNDFYFTRPTEFNTVRNPYTESFRIWYFEVDRNFVNISGGFQLEYGKPFYDIVSGYPINMRPDETKFFRIIELDEAGNRTEYFVQLRGEQYRDRIWATGMLNSAGQEVLGASNLLEQSVAFGMTTQSIRGRNIKITDVRDFMNNNPFFEITICGFSQWGNADSVTIRRAGPHLSYRPNNISNSFNAWRHSELVGGRWMFDGSNDIEYNDDEWRLRPGHAQHVFVEMQFIDLLQGALDRTLPGINEQRGVREYSRRLSINTRGQGGKFETELIQIQPTSGVVTLQLPRFNPFPGRLTVEINSIGVAGGIFGFNGLPFSKSQWEVRSFAADTPMSERVFQMGALVDLIEDGSDMNFDAFNRRVILDPNLHYIIRVTDVFGRDSWFAWYGSPDSDFFRLQFSNNAWVKGGEVGHDVEEAYEPEIFIGDASGVTVTYSRSSFDIEVLREGVPVSLAPATRPGNVDVRPTAGGIESVIITPVQDDHSRWEIRAIRRIYCETRGRVGRHASFDEITTGPNASTTVNRVYEARDLSGGSTEPRGFNWTFYTKLPQPVFSNRNGVEITNLADGIAGTVVVSYQNDGLFETWAEFVRDDDPVESIGPFNSKFELTLPGRYVFTVKNMLNAIREYEFEIIDVTNTSYKVYYEFEHLKQFNLSNGIHVIDGETYLVRGGRGFKELAASPVPRTVPLPGRVFGSAETIRVPNFFIPGNIARSGFNDFYGSARPDSSDRLRIEVSTNSLRTVRTNRTIPSAERNHVWDAELDNNSLLFRLQSMVSGSDLFFALTVVPDRGTNGIPESPIGGNAATAVSLQVHDRGAAAVYPSQTDTPRRNFFFYNRMLPAQGDEVRTNGFVTTNGFIMVGLSQRSVDDTGNLLFVDYRYNGVYAGTLTGMEQLRINAADYGSFEFFVRDVAGRVKTFREFGGDRASGGNNSMLIHNFTQVPIMVGNQPVVDGRVYNGAVTLSLLDLPGNTIQADSYFLDSLVIRHNGRPIPHAICDDTLATLAREAGITSSAARVDFERGIKRQTRHFPLTEPGTYDIEFRCFLGRLDGESVRSRHSFRIVFTDSDSSVQSFHFGAQSNMTVADVRVFTTNSDTTAGDNRAGGADVTRQLPTGWQNGFAISSATGGNGVYRVTVVIDSDNIFQYQRSFWFEVRIRNKPPHEELVTASVGFGTSTTTDSVILRINSERIHRSYGEVEVVVLRDGVIQSIGGSEVRVVSFGSNGNVDMIDAPRAIGTVSARGNYQVVILKSNGIDVTTHRDGIHASGVEILRSDSFQIDSTLDNLAWLFVVAAVVALAIGAFIFWRIRTNLRVK
jgi:hypothetical protein